MRFLARASGMDSREVEDLVQATFLEVYRSAGRFRRHSQVRTWILGIAANQARHYVRRMVRRNTALHGLATRPIAQPARPDESFERAELLARLERGCLTGEDRCATALDRGIADAVLVAKAGAARGQLVEVLAVDDLKAG